MKTHRPVVLFLSLLLVGSSPAESAQVELDPYRDPIALAVHVALSVPPDGDTKIISRFIGSTYMSLGMEEHAMAVARLIDDPAFTVDMLSSRANRAARERRYTDMIHHLAEAIRRLKTIPEPEQRMAAWSDIGWVYYQLGWHVEALRVAEDALRDVPGGNRGGQFSDLLHDVAAALADQEEDSLALRAVEVTGSGYTGPGPVCHYQRNWALQQLAVKYAELDRTEIALEIIKQIPDSLHWSAEIDRALITVAIAFARNREIHRAMSLSDTLPAREGLRAGALTAIAVLADSLGMESTADWFLDLAFDLMPRLEEDTRGDLQISQALFGLAKAEADRARLDNALRAARSIIPDQSIDENRRRYRAAALAYVTVQLAVWSEISRSQQILDEAIAVHTGFRHGYDICRTLAAYAMMFRDHGLIEEADRLNENALGCSGKLRTPEDKTYVLGWVIDCCSGSADKTKVAELLLEGYEDASGIEDAGGQARALHSLGQDQYRCAVPIDSRHYRIFRQILNARGSIWRPPDRW